MDFTKVLHYPSVEAAHFLKNLVLPDEAVMAQQHSIVHYESGIKTIEFPVTADIGLYEELIRAHKVAYLLVLEEPEGPYYFPSQNERLQELVASGEIGLAFIGSGERWVVYQISLLAS